jgi:hypothetical protein
MKKKIVKKLKKNSGQRNEEEKEEGTAEDVNDLEILRQI